VKPAIALLLLIAPLLGQQAKEAEVRTRSQTYQLPPLRFQAESDQVAVDVVVRTPDGQPLAGLERNRFRIFDNGQPRPITAFAVSTAPPPPATPYAPRSGNASAPPQPAAPAPRRAIALYFDDVNTEKNDLANARLAAQRFVREALEPNDRAAVFTASAVQHLSFTGDDARILATIAQLRTHPRNSDSMLGCPRITPYQAFQITVQHDPMALQAAVDERNSCPGENPEDDLTGKPIAALGLAASRNATEPVLAQAEATWTQAEGIAGDTLRAEQSAVAALAGQAGSRMLLMASGGFLGGGMLLEQQQEAIIQAALRANVVINALDAKGLYSDGPGRPLNEATDHGTLPLSTFIFEETEKLSMREAEDEPMATLAQSTGGMFFHDNNDLTLGFYRLGMLPETTYHLAFSPSGIPRDGKYHRLRIEVAQSGKDIVQARRGYFAPGAETADLSQEMDNAMRDQAEEPNFKAQVGARPEGQGRLAVDIRLDPDQIGFLDEKGRRRENLIFVAGLFRPEGTFLVGKQAEMDLALADTTWKKLETGGFSAKLTLDAPAGAYRLRVVVGEKNGGKLFADGQRIEVH